MLLGLLIQARESLGVSGNQLAKRLGLAQSTISRWEAGRPVPSLADVRKIVDALELAGEERDRILALAESAGEDTWLTTGTPGISEQLAGVMDAERDARRITEYNPLVMPGLLQTGDYARAVISDPQLSRADRDMRVMVRMGRRDAILRRDNPVELLALIGEPAIRGRLGGAAVMLDQLRKLIDHAQLPTVTVQVVSVGTERWHPGYLSGFYLYEFAAPLPAMVYLEHYTFGEFLVDVPPDTHVQRYLAAETWLREVAYSPEDSLALIAEQITSLEAAQHDAHDAEVAQSVSQPGRRGVRPDR